MSAPPLCHNLSQARDASYHNRLVKSNTSQPADLNIGAEKIVGHQLTKNLSLAISRSEEDADVLNIELPASFALLAHEQY